MGSDFAQIGVYDEKLKGAGHHDVDLRDRFARTGGWAVRRGYQPSGEKYSAGWSVPNDPDPKVAINQAKVKYVDPELKFKNWRPLDGRNKTIAGSQTETKRNSERQFTELGIPWVEVEWPWVREAAPPGDRVLGAPPGDRVPGVPRPPVRLLPALTFGRWQEGEAEIAVTTPELERLKGLARRDPGRLRIITLGRRVAELVFGSGNAAAVALSGRCYHGQ